MILDKMVLLGGEPIFISNVGSVKSPKLELIKTQDGYFRYQSYMIALMSDTKGISDFFTGLNDEDPFKDLSDLDKLETPYFSLLIKSPQTRELLKEALSFFIVDDVIYSEKHSCYLVNRQEGDKLLTIGYVAQDNFGEVVGIIKQLLHSEDNDPNNLTFSSETAKQWWLEAQKKESELPKVDSANYELSNIISKLCALNIGYNLLNIWDLTIYCLYDQLSAYIQNRMSSISENAYAHNGGDKFDAMAWFKNNK